MLLCKSTMKDSGRSTALYFKFIYSVETDKFLFKFLITFFNDASVWVIFGATPKL